MEKLQERYASNPEAVALYDTAALREEFLVTGLIQPGAANFQYSHYDRMIIGGVVPQGTAIALANFDNLKSEFFLQRRELGIINVGGAGTVEADGKLYAMEKLDCLYLGRGTKSVQFSSSNGNQPAKFFLLSAPAHKEYPSTLMQSKDATPAHMGETATANKRTIYKYIHEDGIRSCQLVMGLTILNEGSVWNTMPPHTHNRRMEVYLYFDVQEAHRVFHFMGQPDETRHLLVANDEAIISPPWSIHSGCGTASYSFIWGMAGENQSFADMDGVAIGAIR
jgi:4-deoxy-L-threo-5-hexosulose-uronate ketol-isomerase